MSRTMLPVSDQPVLVAVGHGSRDPRSAATVERLAAQVRAQAPWLDVRTAFLDLSAPLLTDVLREVHHQGHRRAVVVPLLLGSAFHARVDLPELIDALADELPLLSVSATPVLGNDGRAEDAALDRLIEAGVGTDVSGVAAGADVGIVVTGVGSARRAANAAVAEMAARWNTSGRYAAVTHAFATCEPDVTTAIARLRAAGARRIAVAPWFLAPGLLLDRVAVRARRADPDVILAAPLGAHPIIAELVLSRYAETHDALATAA